MKKTYLQLHIPLAGFNTDVLSGILHREGCLGILEESEDEWLAYLPGTWGAAHLDGLLAHLRSLNGTFDIRDARVEQRPYEDWNSEWRRHFQPLEVVAGIWLRPPWEALPAHAAGIDIIIDPQMAFGTGHHETTRLMIRALQGMDMKGASLLDLGTGSGILAFCARRMGAATVLGVDHDPDAIDNAVHNRALNKLTGIELRVGELGDAEEKLFSCICANIQYGVLQDMGSALAARMAPGGLLLVSGLLHTDVEPLVGRYREAGLRCRKRLDENEWSALLFERR